MFIRFDVIHERDRRTDGQTLHDSKDSAYASHHAVIKLHSYLARRHQMPLSSDLKGDTNPLLLLLLLLLLLYSAPRLVH